MKTLIIYYSQHHKNTKKLVDAVVECGDVDVVRATEEIPDISRYELIGFASGIYYGRFAKQVTEKAATHNIAGKKVFLMYTCGVRRKKYGLDIKEIIVKKGAQLVGEFCCRGYDTFGPFKIIGGIAKGKPGNSDLAAVKSFYSSIVI